MVLAQQCPKHSNEDNVGDTVNNAVSVFIRKCTSENVGDSVGASVSEVLVTPLATPLPSLSVPLLAIQ